MEKRGEALYRKAARVSKKREVADMLTALASDEVAHAAEFARLYDEPLPVAANTPPTARKPAPT